ncbi:phage tail tape measure protein [Xanthobacter sp. VTT E-85241]|uniref:phage tail tape measure protein n=1 Tax=Roseixanthobacter finlandensis TaxID=3119922 RepID=UPI00372BB702
MANRLTMLVARLKDEMSGPAAKAGLSLGRLAASGKELDKLAGSTGEVNDLMRAIAKLEGESRKGQGALGGMGEEARRLARRLAELEGEAGKFTKFREAQKTFAAARTSFRTAQEEVQRLGREMAQAEKPTIALRKAYARAQAEVKNAASAFERQRDIVGNAARALREAGTPISKVTSAERGLKVSIEEANGALRRQADLLRRQPNGLGPGVGRPGPGFRLPPSRAPERAPPGETGFGHGAMAAAGVGGAVLAGVGAPILGAAAVGAGAKQAFDTSIGFERGMDDVQRATDVSAEDLGKLAKGLMDLARATGTSKEELASLMAAGGFAGRPKGELPAFTEYAAKASRAWGVNAGDTGQALAEIGNMFDADQARIQEIGDAVNTVADNTAAKESDLLSVLRRTGQLGRQSGLTPEQTLAFAAAQKSVGVGDEVASSTFNTLMNAMALGEGFLKDSADGYKALGLNPHNVQKDFASKPLETTLMLLQRINSIKDPIKKAETLTNLFGKEYQDNIATLSSQYENLTKILAGVAEKTQYVGSVQKGFDQQLTKDFSKYDRAWQSIDVLMTRVGDYLKGGVGVVSQGIIDTVEGYERPPEPNDEERAQEDAVLALRAELLDRIEKARLLMPHMVPSLEVRLRDVQKDADAIELRRKIRNGTAQAPASPGLAFATSSYPGKPPAFGDYKHPEPLAAAPDVLPLYPAPGTPYSSGLPAGGEGALGVPAQAFALPLTQVPARANSAVGAPAPAFAPPPAPAAPQVDLESLNLAGEKARDVGEMMKEYLGVSIAPTVDTASMMQALDLARQLNAELARSGTLAAQAEAAGRQKIKGFNVRGSFAPIY